MSRPWNFRPSLGKQRPTASNRSPVGLAGRFLGLPDHLVKKGSLDAKDPGFSRLINLGALFNLEQIAISARL